VPNTVRDFVGYGPRRPDVVWPEKARVAISLVLNFEEGAERTPLYGDNVVIAGEGNVVDEVRRDLQGESIFDYGSRIAFWRLMDLFDRYEVKATVFGCGMALEQNPGAAREFVARGHEPVAHGYRYAPMYTFTRDQEREQIRKAVEAFRLTTGQRPDAWYSSGHSEHTRELVVEEGGFTYDSDSYAEDIPYFVMVHEKRWLVIPYNLDTNDMKFRLSPGYSEPHDFFLQLKNAFDCLYEEGATDPKMMSVGLHARLSGRPARIEAVEEFIRYAKGFSRVWFARRIEIAHWWLDRYGHLDPLGS
jgi:peptidoglycan/xylan/chitin deacetylase (PgdA/CDA1 family)